ncbi:hypothetical protein MMC28_000771 [Mycoblastus sanguinarius]|nr:hypothetical protein [Mycoblastus sanguinarius]
MPRNSAFQSYEPFRSQDSLELRHDRITGPFSFLNPTRASFKHIDASEKPYNPSNSANSDHVAAEAVPKEDNEQPASEIEFKWRSRDNRKGRHALVVDPSSDPSAKYLAPKPTSGIRGVGQGIWRMCSQFPYWDVSWLVAIILTLGSAVWVINAFFAFLPFVQPKADFKNETLYAGGISAFIGATIFEIGSVLLMIEAMNEDRAGCFGWALEQVFSGDEKGGQKIRIRPDKDGCLHHQTNEGNFVGKGSVKGPAAADLTQSPDASSGEVVKTGENEVKTGRGFVWWPSWHDLKTHYLRELGFLASFAQLCGASIFWISGFTALPGINNKMSQGLLDGIYWVPQMVGGTGNSLVLETGHD